MSAQRGPYEVKCPSCGSPPGKRCYGNGDMPQPHNQRVTLAERDYIAALKAEVTRLHRAEAEVRQALGGILSGLGMGSGQPEVPITAASAEEWMRRWRIRAEAAEADLASLRKRIEEATMGWARKDREAWDVQIASGGAWYIPVIQRKEDCDLFYGLGPVVRVRLVPDPDPEVTP